MNIKTFHYSPSFKPLSVINSFLGTSYEKKLLKDILVEWNTRISLSDLCKKWKKECPIYKSQNLLFLVYNVEGLNTHLADMDILLNKYQPHICILSGVGAAVRRFPTFPGYTGIAQVGSNSFGGVAILYRNTLKCKVIERDINFLVIETSIVEVQLKIGAVYVPPHTSPPFHLLSKYKNNPFVFFGDCNAKHTHWNCPSNNKAGNELFNWLEHSGVEVIYSTKATSRRSEAIIDFGITHDANGWQIEVIDEGTSDHRPILFQSSYCVNDESFFRKTNWNIFSFFYRLYLSIGIH